MRCHVAVGTAAAELRAELVQVGAMVLCWIAAIDGRSYPSPTP